MSCPVGNVKECACSEAGCPNHAKCCDCVKAHRESGSLPACLRGMEKKPRGK